MEWVWRIASFLLGGGVFALWDRFHPQTCVRYEVRLSSLPSHSDMAEDTFAEVVFWNPSRRVPATNLTAKINVRASGEVRVGTIRTEEDPGGICMDLEGSESRGYLNGPTYRLAARRLAPGAQISVPLWFKSLFGVGGEVTVQGTTSEAVIASSSSQTRRERTAAIAWLIFSAFAIALFATGLWRMVGYRGPTSNALPQGPRTLMLQTAQPEVPQLRLRADGSVEVMLGDHTSSAALEVARSEGGDFAPSRALSGRITRITLESPHPDLWLRAGAYNGPGGHAYSRVLHVPASGQ